MIHMVIHMVHPKMRSSRAPDEHARRCRYGVMTKTAISVLFGGAGTCRVRHVRGRKMHSISSTRELRGGGRNGGVERGMGLEVERKVGVGLGEGEGMGRGGGGMIGRDNEVLRGVGRDVVSPLSTGGIHHRAARQ